MLAHRVVSPTALGGAREAFAAKNLDVPVSPLGPTRGLESVQPSTRSSVAPIVTSRVHRFEALEEAAAGAPRQEVSRKTASTCRFIGGGHPIEPRRKEFVESGPFSPCSSGDCLAWPRTGGPLRPPLGPHARKQIPVPTTANTPTQAPSAPAPPTPSGPLARYRLHPGQETSAVVHHVLHLLLALARVAVPAAVVVLGVLAAARLALWLARHHRAHAGGQLVTIAPGPEVDPAGAEALWNGLHGLLRRSWWGSLTGRPHVAFELFWSAGRLGIAIWLPAGVPAARVAAAAQAAWPGASTQIDPAPAPLPAGIALAAGELRLAEPEWFGIRTEHPADPYRMLFGALSRLDPDQSAVVQVLARPAAARCFRRCRKAAITMRTGRSRSMLVRFVDFWLTKGAPRPANLSGDPARAADIRADTEKSASVGFEAAVRYGVASARGAGAHAAGCCARWRRGSWRRSPSTTHATG